MLCGKTLNTELCDSIGGSTKGIGYPPRSVVPTTKCGTQNTDEKRFRGIISESLPIEIKQFIFFCCYQIIIFYYFLFSKNFFFFLQKQVHCKFISKEFIFIFTIIIIIIFQKTIIVFFLFKKTSSLYFTFKINFTFTRIFFKVLNNFQKRFTHYFLCS